MAKIANIIQRRDLDPILLKANEVIRHYEKVSNCMVSVLGPDGSALENSRHPKAMFFCALCKHYNKCAGEMGPNEYPCTAMHYNAIKEARKLGGSYVYTCPIGFIFWTSPFYSGERLAGTLVSGGILAVEHRQAVERISAICQGGIPREEIELYLEDIPEKNAGHVKALAQMMLICAEQISESDSRQSLQPETVCDASADALDGKPAGNTHQHHCPDACPQDKERMLLASLRRGDNDEAQKILRELLGLLQASSGGNFDYFKLLALELVVLLSRAAAESGDSGGTGAIEVNNRYLKKIEESLTPEEISGNLNVIVNRIGGNIFSFQGVRHASALRKAERFIWENYTHKISLGEIAAVSGLSAPYFSTVFKEEMGENLSNYLNRLRVEKAAAMLRGTDAAISDVAADCGFEDQSWFSKIFKNYMGCSPSKYREHDVQGSGGGVAVWMNPQHRQVLPASRSTTAGGAA